MEPARPLRRRRAVRLCERGAPLVPPRRRRRVESLPRELGEQETAADARDLVDDGVEVVDVVERPRRNDNVVAVALVPLDRLTAEDPSLGRVRVDGGDVVAVGGEDACERAAAAADLEHARRRRREVRAHELELSAGSFERLSLERLSH